MNYILRLQPPIGISLDAVWMSQALESAISAIDWAQAISDVQRFLPVKEQTGLRQWHADLFLYHARRLGEYMGQPG